jgi:hypothetical protein
MPTNLKKIFFDTEFTGLTQDTSLIAMALVADSGEEFYAEFTDFNQNQVNDWINANVISQLFINDSNQSFDNGKMYIKGDKSFIAENLKKWFTQFGPIENTSPYLQIWADVPHYDWVLFCDLFGGAFGIPASIHYMPMDIATLLFTKGYDSDIGREEFNISIRNHNIKKHSALYDSLVIKGIFEKIYSND